MFFTKFIENINQAADKMQDYAKKELEGKQTTIMHSVLSKDSKEAKRVAENPSVRSFKSTENEFFKRLRGI